MLSRRAIVVFALIALCAIVAVQAKLHRPVAKAGRRLHPEETADDATRANWARIHKELEARNYSRPTKEQLAELGYESQSHQLGAGTYGTDVSSWQGEGTWACIKSKGYDFAIVREWEEVCGVDGNGVHTVANAWAAGLAHVDIYLFPSYGCRLSAAQQVDATIAAMGGIPFGSLWFDVETGGQGSAANNIAWLNAGVQHAVSRLGGSRVGVYASVYEWGQVMGGYNGPTSQPIWYADYDGSPSFAGWRSFGGWGSPAMKQFAGDSNICGADVDLNWY